MGLLSRLAQHFKIEAQKDLEVGRKAIAKDPTAQAVFMGVMASYWTVLSFSKSSVGDLLYKANGRHSDPKEDFRNQVEVAYNRLTQERGLSPSDACHILILNLTEALDSHSEAVLQSMRQVKPEAGPKEPDLPQEEPEEDQDPSPSEAVN